MLPITARVRDKQSFHVARPQKTHAVVLPLFCQAIRINGNQQFEFHRAWEPTCKKINQSKVLMFFM